MRTTLESGGSTGTFHAGENANDSQVGGRQQALRLAPGGGGYQNVCTAPGDAVGAPAAPAPTTDPRIAELRRVGLPRIWIALAQAIGFDAFVVAWQTLMRHGHVDDRNRIVVPNLQRYMRFQRNQMIRQLVADGFGIDEVQQKVKDATGESCPNLTSGAQRSVRRMAHETQDRRHLCACERSKAGR